MSGQNYYLLTALPGLGELGADPPLTPRAMLEMLAPSPSAQQLASVIFLSDDLLLRQAVMSGEIPADQAEPVVLSAEQVRDEAPLPAFLANEAGPDGEGGQGESAGGAAQLGVDRVWALYFEHAARGARGGEMLAEWVRYEVGLRNALAAARAKALGLDAARYLVAEQLGRGEEEYAAVLGEWSAAANPLAGLKVLDAARWNWIAEHSRHFTFSDDELAAYAARLVILHRWKRIAAAQQVQAQAPGQR
jgi:hypothetical protein